MGGAVALLACLWTPAVARADLRPFGHSCGPLTVADQNKNAVTLARFCPTDTSKLPSVDNRVASFDGTPLDVDVTLPLTGSGPFPTIVMLHGLGNDKTTFEQGAADPNIAYHYTNADYAQRGFAVVNYTARGFGNSCGTVLSRTPSCAAGWSHIADQRYEARDTQYLLGLLVDEGIAQPGALGVTGISYGGGQSIELAYLKNRIRCAGETLPGDPCNGQPNGAFIAWKSPNGTPLAISAAYARWPWSDLMGALLPNGQFLDTDPRNGSSNPIGVLLQSTFTGVFVSGALQWWYFPPQEGVDPSADLAKWYSVFSAGEPYGPDAQAVATELSSYHQGLGLPGTPAPLLLESGWNDALFPVDQSLRAYNSVRAASPGAKIALQIGDLGHSTGADKFDEDKAYNDQGAGFFDAWLRGVGTPPAPGGVSAFTQTCSYFAPAGGPYTASRWTALHTGSFTFGSAGGQTVTSDGGSATLAAGLDPGIPGDPVPGGPPFTNGRDACQPVPAEIDPGTAVYTATSPGLTLMGRPTVTATVNTIGLFGELAGRLWDVQPDRTQRLITRGVYRLLDNQQGQITFQLNGNGYTIGADHTIKLELLGRDAPYYRASNGTFTIQVSNLTASLPTAAPLLPSYHIVNQASGECVDAASAGTANGTALVQSPCSTQQPSQGWQFEPTQDGYSHVFNGNASAEDPSWDVTNRGTTDGTPIELWEYGGGTNQQWQPVPLGNGYRELTVLNGGKCLDVPGGTATNGVQLQISTCNGSPEQAFLLNKQS